MLAPNVPSLVSLMGSWNVLALMSFSSLPMFVYLGVSIFGIAWLAATHKYYR